MRNGKAPNGKQKYRCKECKKQSREGSGSLEQDSQLCIVAMKKEEQKRAQLVQFQGRGGGIFGIWGEQRSTQVGS